MHFIDDSAKMPAGAAGAPSQSAYIAGWAKLPPAAVAANVHGRVEAIADGDRLHSVYRPDPRNDASYFASISRFYVDLAAIEFARAPSPLLRVLAVPLPPIAALLRALGIDRGVWINESLLATGPLDSWSGCDLAALAATAVARFPRDAIILKSLNDYTHKAELQMLEGRGFRLIPARSIWIFDSGVPGWRATRHFRGDRNNLARLPSGARFDHGPFTSHDYERMAELHRRMLSTHPNRLHPRYNAAFYRLCHDSGLFKFAGLRAPDGEITAFIMVGNGIQAISASAMGIDQSAHAGRSIYPSLVAMTLDYAMTMGKPVNLGYGADRFKRLRGARPALEFHAVYVAHLPLVRRALWKTVLEVIARAAGPALARLSG